MSASFETTSDKAQNQFVARLVSKKSGKTVAFVNIVDQFARDVFGTKDIETITADEVTDILKPLVDKGLLELAVTDVTAELEVVDATDY